MTNAKYGRKPAGERLVRIKQSPNYKEGQFMNRHETPQLAEGYSMPGVMWKFLFGKKPRRIPVDQIGSIKIDLLGLQRSEDLLVWFGHSSYFIQIDGRRILVDPVFSGNASPVRGIVKAFRGTDRYTAADFPEIDYLMISHDHYDHLDYPTIILLRSKVKRVICGLGVGAHFEHWGYDPAIITECDWDERVQLEEGFVVNTFTARHFSGRGFTRNNTLWLSVLLQTPTMKIFLGGDSGYDDHFAAIGAQFGPIDLAILEAGQYDQQWKYIHTLPGEVVQAGHDLRARRVFPVHNSKFPLGNHSWDEPMIEVSRLNARSEKPLNLITPMIGEAVRLKDPDQVFREWWVGIR